MQRSRPNPTVLAFLGAVAASLAFVAGGCGGESSTQQTDAAAMLPASYFMDVAPEESRNVSEIRSGQTPEAGQRIVVRGVVGGSRNPFVEGRAIFTLMGDAIRPCNEIPGDNCGTPWDYCCDARGDILANSATIRVVDENGEVLRAGVRGAGGVRELSELIVDGVVARTEGDALVVNASAIHVVRK